MVKFKGSKSFTSVCSIPTLEFVVDWLVRDKGMCLVAANTSAMVGPLRFSSVGMKSVRLTTSKNSSVKRNQ